MHLYLVFEDLIISAYHQYQVDIVDGKEYRHTGHWEAKITDTFKGTSHNCHWTCEQITAIAALALGMGENALVNDDAIDKLYEIAESGLVDCPVRPIP